MAKLERYISVGRKRLRCGYTTGTCAAAASRAAVEYLVSGVAPAAVCIDTPAGVTVTADIEDPAAGPGWARCAVRKDGGDDPDVTDGVLVYAHVEFTDEPGAHIDGGEGVGRVTKSGLDQPIGAAAINSTPRRMIAEQVEEVLKDSDRGVAVTISVPEGVRIAAKTFNPRLGIVGGISIIGTSGIVKPMSEDALISSIQLELRVRAAEGIEHVLMSPGNYGIDFADGELDLDCSRAVQCSNYMGAALDGIADCGFKSVLIVGHIGKMVKVAAGAMNTHSHVVDARLETLAAHAALAGASKDTVAAIMQCVSTDAALDIMKGAGVMEAAMESLTERAHYHVKHRLGDEVRIELIIFSKVHGLLGKTPGADELVALHRRP